MTKDLSQRLAELDRHTREAARRLLTLQAYFREREQALPEDSADRFEILFLIILLQRAERLGKPLRDLLIELDAEQPQEPLFLRAERERAERLGLTLEELRVRDLEAMRNISPACDMSYRLWTAPLDQGFDEETLEHMASCDDCASELKRRGVTIEELRARWAKGEPAREAARRLSADWNAWHGTWRGAIYDLLGLWPWSRLAKRLGAPQCEDYGPNAAP